MAKVTRGTALARRIDSYLDDLLCAWKAMPEQATEWEHWDADDRLMFDLDWRVPEDRLQQLIIWAERGLLSAEQQHRYVELQELIAQHRPLLEGMLAKNPAQT